MERVEGAGQVNIYSLRVGGKQPLHQGAAPRALLVGLDEEELTAYAHRSQLLQATPQTIRSLKELAADVECTRRQGYTISSNDATIGIAAVGAPIYDHHERVVASISLSGLAHRYEGERLARICQVIQDVSSRFSRQLGYVPTSTTH
jgi:DNA-binding IclR family transcriptional regulator